MTQLPPEIAEGIEAASKRLRALAAQMEATPDHPQLNAFGRELAEEATRLAQAAKATNDEQPQLLRVIEGGKG